MSRTKVPLASYSWNRWFPAGPIHASSSAGAIVPNLARESLRIRFLLSPNGPHTTRGGMLRSQRRPVYRTLVRRTLVPPRRRSGGIAEGHGPRGRVDDVVVADEQGQPQAIAQPHLSEGRGQMALHGLLRDPEHARDLLVARAFSDEAGDLCLAARQRAEPAAHRRPPVRSRRGGRRDQLGEQA